MALHYLRVALRTFFRHKAFTGINIIGLALGIACCTVMLLYVQDEMAFDGFHSKGDRVYRLIAHVQTPEGDERQVPYVMGTIGPAMVAEQPNVVASVRIRDRFGIGRFSVANGERKFYEGDCMIAEPSFLKVFDFELVRGDAERALANPRSVVLTEESALKYFGVEDPLGKTLSTDRFGEMKVTGILRNPPDNSHLQFSMVFPFALLESHPAWLKFIQSWDSDGFLTYVLLSHPVAPSEIDRNLQAMLAAHRPALSEKLKTVTAQALSDVHFGSGSVEFDHNAGKGSRGALLAFAGIALLVLVIACINYMNLATARSMKRAKEIGMRKVAGASRMQLTIQTLVESALISLMSLVLALVLVEFILSDFNALTAKNLSLNLLDNIPFTLGLFSLTLIIGALAGIAPALSITRLNLLKVLRNQKLASTRGFSLRSVLVVVQFSLSVIMIIATIVAHRQLAFVRSKDLGFNREQVLVVDINSGNTRSSFEAIKAEMARLPEVKAVTVSSRVPGEWKNLTEINAAPAGAAETQLTTMNFIGIDQDFLRTFQMELLAGRNFSGIPADTSAVIVNEAAARMLGWAEPIGREIIVPSQNYRARVIGVVRDFHFRSLREPIGPMVLGYRNNPIIAIDYFSLRVATADITGMLASLKAIHEKFDNVTPLEYNFLDERINDFYADDRRVETVFTLTAFLAIAIACLGLLGLLSFIMEQRTKEIGIRKVLGASVPGILVMLSKDFAILVLISTVIAVPVASTALQSWLRDFAYRIELSWWIFALAGAMALAIALLTVSIQTIKAAAGNPVDSLRYE